MPDSRKPIPELARNKGALLHDQISSVLRSGILSGRYMHGELVPGEAQLMEMFGVSRATVRRALLTLELEELIERRQGKGTRVTYQPDPRDKASLKQFFERLDVISKGSRVEFHEFGWSTSPPDVQAALGVGPEELVLKIARVRWRDEGPHRYVLTYVPEFAGKFIHQKELGNGTIIRPLAKAGWQVTRYYNEIGAILADPLLAAALQVRIGEPLVEISRLLMTSEGQPVAYNWSAVAPNRSTTRVMLHEGNGSYIVMK